jgi:hypothetical protein
MPRAGVRGRATEKGRSHLLGQLLVVEPADVSKADTARELDVLANARLVCR